MALKVGDTGIYQKDKTGKVGPMINFIGHTFKVVLVDSDGYNIEWVKQTAMNSGQYYIHKAEVNNGVVRNIPWL